MKQTRRDLIGTLVAVGSAGFSGCSALMRESTESPSADNSSTSDPLHTTPDSRTLAQETSDAPSSTVSNGSPVRTDSPMSSTPPHSPSATSLTDSSTATAKPTSPPFQFMSEITTTKPTAETPPILRVQITNTDDRAHVLVTPHYTFSINPLLSETGPQEMQIIPRSTIKQVVHSDAPPECWKSAQLPKDTLRNSKRIDAGESLTGEYAILPVASKSEELSACWGAGTYRFSHLYWVGSTNEESPEGNPFRWIVEIRITDRPAINIAATTVRWE